MPSYLPLSLITSQTPATVRFHPAPASWATARWTRCQQRCRTRGACPSRSLWWIRGAQREKSILSLWLIMASRAQGKTQLVSVSVGFGGKKAGFMLEFVKWKSKGKKNKVVCVCLRNVPQFHNMSVNCWGIVLNFNVVLSMQLLT